MAFSEDILKKAFARSGSRCECGRSNHNWHAGRCSKTFTWGEHRTQWEAHHQKSVDAGGTDTLENCEILCLRCHGAVPK